MKNSALPICVYRPLDGARQAAFELIVDALVLLDRAGEIEGTCPLVSALDELTGYPPPSDVPATTSDLFERRMTAYLDTLPQKPAKPSMAHPSG